MSKSAVMEKAMELPPEGDEEPQDKTMLVVELLAQLAVAIKSEWAEEKGDPLNIPIVISDPNFSEFQPVQAVSLALDSEDVVQFVLWTSASDMEALTLDGEEDVEEEED